MSWIVTPNLITLSTADATTGWTNQGATVTTALNTDIDVQIQGTGCSAWGLKNTGVYYLYYTGSSTNLQNQHFYIWFNTFAQKMLNTYNNKGLSVMVGSIGAWSVNNIAIWTVDGSDTYPGGWQCYVIDCNSQPDWSGSGWIGNSIQTVGKFGMVFSASVAGARAGNNVLIDAIRYGSGLTIFSGSSTNPANWEALYQTDNSGSNKYGIISKRAGVYFLQGKIQIGTPESSSYFNDYGQIVQFESKYVSESLYRIDITGSRTTCSFGQVVGSGESSIGVSPIIIRGPETLQRFGVSGGPASFTQSLRPVFFVSPEVREVQFYGTRFDSLKELNFGSSGSSMNVSKLKLIDNTFSNTFPITKNFNGTASLLLNNKLVSTTGSFTPVSSSYAIILYDTGSIDSSEFQVLNSYGFSSLSTATTQSFDLTNQNFSSNEKYITIYQNKTWNVVNPTWNTPTTNSLMFLSSTGNLVNEQYSYDTTVVDSNLNPLSASKVYIYEGLLTQSIVYRSQTDINGETLFNITKNIYNPTESLSPRQHLTQSYGNFGNKIYNYGYTPYIAGLTVASPIVQNIALIVDSAVTEPSQITALAFSSSIFVTRETGSNLYPIKVFNYKSGSTPLTVGTKLTGSVSLATGQVLEYFGSTADGTVVLRYGNSASFTHNEVLRDSTNVSYATSSVWSSDGGFSGSYTWLIDANSNPMTSVYNYLAAEMAAWPIRTQVFENVLVWGRNSVSQLLYSGQSGYYTLRNTTLREGVWVGRSGTGTIAYYTSDEGVTYIPPVQYSLTLTGLIAGSEVRVYITSSVPYGVAGTELAGVESSGTSFSYNYIYEGDKYVDIVIVNTDYEYIRISDVLISNANSSIPIQQRFDRNYRNPPGS